jgi:uridine kinase
MPAGPLIIGVAGPSCSGKSEIARCLIKELSGMNPVLLALDSYYHDLSPLDPAEREKRNFDVPGALDHELLKEQLLTFANGNAIEKPVYDFATHKRSQQSERIVPGETVVVEGLFALYWEEIRDLFHTCVFVTLHDHICLSRRIARDTKERGRSHESILAQYTETVRPMNEKYILPTKTFADIVVNGENLLEQSTALIMAHISSAINHNSYNRQSKIINHQSSNPGIKDGKNRNIL